MQISIPCPGCNQAQIPMETNLLLSGAAFTCPHCQVQLSLDAKSVPIAAEGLKQFENFAQEVKGLKTNGEHPSIV